MKQVIIHTDGACQGNPGPGGWAAVLEYGPQVRETSGGEPATTNNRMELLGAIQALKCLQQPCLVDLHTDSEYLRAGISKGVPFWKRNGWRTVAKTPVKNKDLWLELDALVAQHQVSWHWLRGHAGHAQNERCDALARQAIVELKKRFTQTQLKEHLARFKAAQIAAAPEPAQPVLAFQSH